MTQNRPRPFRKISDIALDTSDILAGLYRRSIDIIDLQDSIRKRLGSPLNAHLHVANFNTDTLIIFTDSAAWAAKLRFHTADILDIARNKAGLDNLKSVRVRISPHLSTSPQP